MAVLKNTTIQGSLNVNGNLRTDGIELPTTNNNYSLGNSTNFIKSDGQGEAHWANLEASDIQDGVFPISRGGTNINAYQIGDILYASATNTLSKLSTNVLKKGYVLSIVPGSNSTFYPNWVNSIGDGSEKAIKIVGGIDIGKNIYLTSTEPTLEQSTPTGEIHLNTVDSTQTPTEAEIILRQSGSKFKIIGNDFLEDEELKTGYTLEIDPYARTICSSNNDQPFTFIGKVTGNATSATYLKDKTNNTASYLNYGGSGFSSDDVTYLACWNGYEVRSIDKDQFLMRFAWWGASDTHDANDLHGGATFAYAAHSNTATTGTLIDFGCGGSDAYSLQIQGSHQNNELFFRNRNGNSGTWGTWNQVVTNSGTWGIGISGNAATATKATQDGNGDTISSTYLKLSGGTMTDSLSIVKAGECGIEVNNTQATNPNQVAFIVGGSGNGGIFSRKHSKWIVYSDASGNVVLNGTANAATKATQDGSGNTITSTYLKLSGGTLTGKIYGKTGNGLEIQSSNTGSWKEGIRIYNASNNYSVLCLTNSDLTDLLALVHNGNTHSYYFDVKTSGTGYTITIPKQHSGTIALTDGHGASGTWGISITGNCGGSSSSCTGNAATATKATQDGDGNTITSTYLKLSGGTLTGNLTISHATSATMTSASTNPQIIFSENGSQPVHLIYTDYDSYRSPAGLKVVGGTSATPAWFEVEGQVYAAGFHGPLTGNVTGNCSGSSGSCTGNAANVTGTVAVAHGGTGVTSGTVDITSKCTLNFTNASSPYSTKIYYNPYLKVMFGTLAVNQSFANSTKLFSWPTTYPAAAASCTCGIGTTTTNGVGVWCRVDGRNVYSSYTVNVSIATPAFQFMIFLA